MSPERFEKTVAIPVVQVSGAFQYLYGGPLPELRDGTIFDIVVPESAVKNKSVLAVLGATHFQEIVPKGESVFCAVSTRHIPKGLQRMAKSLHEIIGRKGSILPASLNPDSKYVEIILVSRP